MHAHPLGGAQSANIHCGNSLATRHPQHTTVKDRQLQRLISKSRTAFPTYFVGKLNASKKWDEVKRISASSRNLTTTVPLVLPSGQDPYEVDVDSPIKFKEEMHQAITEKMAFLHRLIKKRRIYGHPTAIPYDENDTKQFPLKPREHKRAEDTCGWCLNQKHYLYRRWCAQQKRCLTAQECKSSLNYAERTPPINGEIFEYYFSGNAFLKRKERASRLKSDRNDLIHLSELGFAEYAISFDLKQRPQHITDSHDRLDNDKGYTFKNVISNTVLDQANNKGTKMMRTKYRNEIQNEYYGQSGKRNSITNNPKAPISVSLVNPKGALAAAFRIARKTSKLSQTANSTSATNSNTKNHTTNINRTNKRKNKPILLDSKGNPRNTLYGYH